MDGGPRGDVAGKGCATGCRPLALPATGLATGGFGGPPLYDSMMVPHLQQEKPTYRRGVGGAASAAWRGVLTARSGRCCLGDAAGLACLFRLETVGTMRRSTEGLRRRGDACTPPTTTPSSDGVRLPPWARQLAAAREVLEVAVSGTMCGASRCLSVLYPEGVPGVPGALSTTRTKGSGMPLASEVRDTCPAERGVVVLDAPYAVVA